VSQQQARRFDSTEQDPLVDRRRLRLLRALAAITPTARSAEEVCSLAAKALAEDPHALPFAMLYLLDDKGLCARLAGSAGLEAGAAGAPASIVLTGASAPDWPLDRVVASGQAEWVEDVVRRFGPLPAGPWRESPHTALILPLDQAGQKLPAGFLIAGLPPRQPLDEDERGFLELVARQVAANLMEVRATELRAVAQRESFEQLQFIMDTLPVYVARCSQERRFIWVNRGYAERFGLTPEQIAGRPIVDILGEAAYASILPFIERVLSGQTLEYEVDVPYQRIGRRWMHVTYAPTFDATGQPDGWVAVISDISRRKSLEQALRSSEERYRSLTEAISSVVWSTNAEGLFMEPQRAWEAYTGQSWEEHHGSGWLQALHPEDRARVQSLWNHACQTRTPYRSEGRLWHAASRTYRHFEMRGVPILHPEGSVREWIGTCLDVHDRKQALEELEEADRRKNEFLAMLAHELRNPLAPILTSVELLRLRGPDVPLLIRHREIIARQVGHMKRLLDDLLDAARVSQGKIQLRQEPLDVAAALQQAVEVSRPLIESKQHELSLTLPREPMQVQGDPTRLMQVFANLLNNAAKYTDPGGKIWIEAAREAGEVVLRVRDTGIGMPPELLERAFDLFTQGDRSLDRAQGGLGIGLTMVQNLVQMHGGSVQASSDGPGRIRGAPAAARQGHRGRGGARPHPGAGGARPAGARRG
jgi:PAS domain S-box-containing protein